MSRAGANTAEVYGFACYLSSTIAYGALLCKYPCKLRHDNVQARLQLSTPESQFLESPGPEPSVSLMTPRNDMQVGLLPATSAALLAVVDENSNCLEYAALYLAWAFLPESVLEFIGISYYASKYAATLILTRATRQAARFACFIVCAHH